VYQDFAIEPKIWLRQGNGMLFEIQKIVGSWLEVPGLFILFILGMRFIYRKKIPKSSSTMLLCSAALLYTISIPVVSHQVLGIFENTRPLALQPNQVDPHNTVVLILGGGSKSYVPGRDPLMLEDEANDTTMARVYYGYLLAKEYKLPIWVSGGQPREIGRKTEAQVMAELLQNWGMPKSQIFQETRSKITSENAKYTLEELPNTVKQVIVVTSAFHLKRAMWCLEHAKQASGKTITFIPGPCDYRVPVVSVRWYHFLPSAKSLEQISLAIHESIGLVYYWIIGM